MQEATQGIRYTCGDTTNYSRGSSQDLSITLRLQILVTPTSPAVNNTWFSKKKKKKEGWFRVTLPLWVRVNLGIMIIKWWLHTIQSSRTWASPLDVVQGTPFQGGIDPLTWLSKSRVTSLNLPTAALWEYGM